MKTLRPLFIFAIVTALWLAPITSPQDPSNNTGIAYAEGGPSDPPVIEGDTTATQPIIDTTTTLGGSVSEESSILEDILEYLAWIIS